MEQIAPIILLILWLVISYLNERRRKASPPKPAQRPETTSLPPERNLTEMLEDLLGGDDDAESKKTSYPKTQPYRIDKTEETVKRVPRELIYQESMEKEGLPEYESEPIYESQEYIHPEYEKAKTEEAFSYESYVPEVTESLEDQYKSGSFRQSVEAYNVSLEKQFEINRANLNRMIEQAEQNETLLVEADVPVFLEFNLRDAIVYSEIINRKYK